jgi:hypothetical protein
MLGWLLYEHGIEPHVTVFDKSARKDGTFSRHDFTCDHKGESTKVSLLSEGTGAQGGALHLRGRA